MDSETLPWPLVDLRPWSKLLIYTPTDFCQLTKGLIKNPQNYSLSQIIFFFFSIDKELVHQLLFCFVTSNSTLLISRVFQAGHFKQLPKTFVCLRNIFTMSYASTYNLSLVFRLTLNLFSFGSFSLLDLSGLSCSLPDKGQFFRQKAPSKLLILLCFWPKWQKFSIKCNC